MSGEIWIQRFEQPSGEVYYYNPETRKVLHEEPSGEIWQEHVDKTTKKMFFYNINTNESKWSLGLKDRLKKKARKKLLNKERDVEATVVKTLNVDPENEASFLIDAAKINYKVPENKSDEKSEEWTIVLDEKSGKSFWYNEKLKKSVWIKPDSDSASVKAITTSNSVSWQKLYDDKSQRFYFYNSFTGESQWNKPKLERLQPKEDNTHIEPSEIDNEWEELIDKSSGRIYFFNRKLGRSQWERPVELKGTFEDEIENVWEEIRDPDSGKIFFHNKLSGVSQWHNPYGVAERLDNVEIPKELENSQQPVEPLLLKESPKKIDASSQISGDAFMDGQSKVNDSTAKVLPEFVSNTSQFTSTSKSPEKVGEVKQNQPMLLPALVPSQNVINVSNIVNEEQQAVLISSAPVAVKNIEDSAEEKVVSASLPNSQDGHSNHHSKQENNQVTIGNNQNFKMNNIIAGYLKKKARQGLRRFLPRFFVLAEKVRDSGDKRYILRYYENEELSVLSTDHALGEIDLVSNVEDLKEVTESDADYDPEFKGLDFKLVINTALLAYVLTLRAYNSADVSQWLRLLRKYRKSVRSVNPPQISIENENVALDEDKMDSKRRQVLSNRLKLAGKKSQGARKRRDKLSPLQRPDPVELAKGTHTAVHEEKSIMKGEASYLDHRVNRSPSMFDDVYDDDDIYTAYDSDTEDEDPNSLNNLLNTVFT